MDLAPQYLDRLSSQSPQPNLQEVLFVMGGRSLDDSDDEDDSDEDEDRDPRLQRQPPNNCAFYNTKTSKIPFPLSKFQACLSSQCILQQSLVGKRLSDSLNQFGRCCRLLNIVLTEKQLCRNAVWM